MALPVALASAVNDMMSGACLALQLNPLLTQGQIEALEHHASAELRALYLPNLISGEWSGTMNLTEPQAEPLGDGTYAVSGQKIFISWGDGDVTENICHLVLARLPGAPEGTNGIQAMDLVARKMADEGEAAFRLMEEVEATAEAARAVLPDLAHSTWAAAETLREATEVLLSQPMETRFAGAVPYLRAFALVLGAHVHLRAALAEQAEAGAPGARSRLARVFIARILTQHGALLAEMGEGAAALAVMKTKVQHWPATPCPNRRTNRV